MNADTVANKQHRETLVRLRTASRGPMKARERGELE